MGATSKCNLQAKKEAAQARRIERKRAGVNRSNDDEGLPEQTQGHPEHEPSDRTEYSGTKTEQTESGPAARSPLQERPLNTRASEPEKKGDEHRSGRCEGDSEEGASNATDQASREGQEQSSGANDANGLQGSGLRDEVGLHDVEHPVADVPKSFTLSLAGANDNCSGPAGQQVNALKTSAFRSVTADSSFLNKA